MKKDYTLRQYQSTDIYEIIELLQDVSLFRPSDDMFEKLRRSFGSSEDAYSCVCTHNSAIVAFGSIFFYQRIRGGITGVIEDVVVDSSYRGLGLGRSIIMRLIDQAEERVACKVILESSDSAYTLYKSIGFAPYNNAMKYTANT
jgi:glucosamine-phosphate N-acetyltransferase